MVAEREKRFGVSSAKNRENRADIEYPVVDPEADAWQRGITPQLQLLQKD